jgi:hypothetical protein
MTMIAALPRCRTELACYSPAAGRDNARRFRQHGCLSTPVIAASTVQTAHQPDPMPLAERPINRPYSSRPYPCAPVAAAKSP